MTTQQNVRVAVLGGGVMGETVVSALLSAGWSADDVDVTEQYASRATELAQRYGVNASDTNPDTVRHAEVVVVGYALAFAVLATVQALVIVGFAVWVCGMDVAGPIGLVVLVAVLDAVLGCALGLGASALARTEFQAVQLMPAIIFPQLVTCGLLLPRDQMPAALEAVSRVLPLTYGVDALQVLASGGAFADVRADVLVITGFILAAVVVGATTLRRRTP